MVSSSNGSSLPKTTEANEDNEELLRNEADLPKIEVFPTKIKVKIWPGPEPLIYKDRPIRSMITVGKVREAFLKRRPYQSRFAINLYYDNALTDKFLNASKSLENWHFIPIKSIPHITFTVSPFEHQSKLEKIIKNLTQNQKIIPLSFPWIKRRRNALGLLAQPSRLLEFHLKLCESMTKDGIEIGEDYRPGTWKPVCFVAKKAPESSMKKGLLALQKLKLPFNGYGVRIKLVEITPKPEKYYFDEEGAVFLFRKVITLADEVLCRFSVPKEIAENEMYFPRLAHGESVDIQVREFDGWIWETMIKRYMNYTYHICANWKVRKEPMRLVAGDVIRFYILKRANVFLFPYEYMIQIEEENTSKDIMDNRSADDLHTPIC